MPSNPEDSITHLGPRVWRPTNSEAKMLHCCETWLRYDRQVVPGYAVSCPWCGTEWTYVRSTGGKRR